MFVARFRWVESRYNIEKSIFIDFRTFQNFDFVTESHLGTTNNACKQQIGA